MAERIRYRGRTAGWELPEGAVYVGRPTRWGNPARLVKTHRGWSIRWLPTGRSVGTFSEEKAHDMAARVFRAALEGGDLRITAEDVRRELAGKDLACWCRPGLACHVDALLEVANGLPILYSGPLDVHLSLVHGAPHG